MRFLKATRRACLNCSRYSESLRTSPASHGETLSQAMVKITTRRQKAKVMRVCRTRECKINTHGASGGIFEVAVAHGKVRFVNNGAHPPVGAGGGVRYTEVRLQGLDDGLVDVTAVGKEKKVEVLVSLL